MSDPYDDLYETKREALETGKYLGGADAINRARIALSKISARCETAGNDVGLKAAEECCKALRAIAEMIEHNRERAKAGDLHS